MKPQGAKAFTSPEIGVERVRNEFHSYLVSYSVTSPLNRSLPFDVVFPMEKFIFISARSSHRDLGICYINV